MIDAARKTIKLMAEGNGLPLDPDNIETTMSSFPIRIQRLLNVTTDGVCKLTAIGFAAENDSFPTVTWVNVDEETSGWQKLSPPIAKQRQFNIIQRFFIEAKRRIGNAWNALRGYDD